MPSAKLEEKWGVHLCFVNFIFTIAIDNIDQILGNMDNGARCFIFENVANCPIQKGMVVYKTNKSSYLKEYVLETNIQTISTGE